ncbi:MAG: hypothetical protein GTO46_03460 [Gemmatimonadetes bacterium]|nr:hypothetical protein [Gemmatimonadota bacterium]NIO30828.1 hypothetical protein [Gemmatimonadota bacterium]
MAKGKVQEGRDRAQQALDAGKKAARAARSELDDRMAGSQGDGDESVAD